MGFIGLIFHCIADMTDMIDRHDRQPFTHLSVCFLMLWLTGASHTTITAEEVTRESRAYYMETTEETEALEGDSETS